jgi:hypothetical protein
MNLLHMDMHCEAVVATGNIEQLRIRTRDASSDICAALMGAVGLGSKPNYPWDQYPSRARTKNLELLPRLNRDCRARKCAKLDQKSINSD